jgi:poly(3-hydroxybutyrate) depolymerase
MWALVWLALAFAPKGDTPVPLVVVLHGDREHARDAAARWRTATNRHGWALLALDVPEGNSWWRWDGDPAWVIAQVDDYARHRAIDRSRVFLVGWSGGATYIGMHAAAWRGTFAAVVIHGGGMAPGDDTCTDLPAYFLVGDKNPLHGLAKDLRGYFETCKAEVAWDLVRGADHGKEEAALTAKKAGAILAWLGAHPQPASAR